MKTVKKEVLLELSSVERRDTCAYGIQYEYLFNSSKLLPIDQNTKVFIEVEEPETLKEFLEENNIPKKELVQWLNKNYK